MRLIFKIWKEFVTSMLQDMLSVRQNLFSVTVVLIDENEMVDDGIECKLGNPLCDPIGKARLRNLQKMMEKKER